MTDPKESNNLAATKSDATRELTKLALDWRATLPKKR
jgi:hypothetical protein